ncbi:MAG TPA: M20/M25/M40 family metallo-hydrolase, partial [Luteimonas sp.]|nr:M20/M25/M40 family metallo-hydrolase [Luteimonas sp.]
MNPLTQALEPRFDTMAPELRALYEDFHRHPELSMQEQRSAGICADWLERHGYAVTRNVGVTGVVGVLRNGEGPTVLLRADMDALPMDEGTGVPYASEVPGVAHSCRHDLHMAWLMGAARVLAEARDAWRGTVTYRPGVILSAGDSLQVTLFGRGAHGSQPQLSVDPVVMAASTVLRLQTIVAREVGPLDSAVLTVSSLQAGTKENIIPEQATLKLNMRTYDEGVREHMLGAVK